MYGANPLTVQRPLIAKGLDLFRQRTTGLVFIDSVVGPVRVEGRVELKQGLGNAFWVIVKCHSRVLFHVVHYIVGNHKDTDGIVQKYEDIRES
ncbi:MAG: hypothetical protein M2R45_05167 [Verrucomicrobia subdivision 3 bacterium]|nr:hypothetical protein [Limisphaerales bacterium]